MNLVPLDTLELVKAGDETVRTLSLKQPVDVRATLSTLRRGGKDPCFRWFGDGVAWGMRTPEGPATMLLTGGGRQTWIEGHAWGTGSAWAIDMLPHLVGSEDKDDELHAMLETHDRPGRRLLRDLRGRMVGLRLTHTHMVLASLIPAILEQKVPGVQAWYAYRRIVVSRGEPAPGPAEIVQNLWIPPTPEILAATPYWSFHEFGVERKRADVIRLVSIQSKSLERLDARTPAEAHAGLLSIRGIGKWTAAEVSLRAFGDADAVSVGDYHLPHIVSWALAGKARSTDEEMLELLEPYRGQRARVIRLLEAGGTGYPRRGPRMTLGSIRDM